MARKSPQRILSLTTTYVALAVAVGFVLATFWFNERAESWQMAVEHGVATMDKVAELADELGEIEAAGLGPPGDAQASQQQERLQRLIDHFDELRADPTVTKLGDVDPSLLLGTTTERLGLLAAALPELLATRGDPAAELSAERHLRMLAHSAAMPVESLVNRAHQVLADYSFEMRMNNHRVQLLLAVACSFALLVVVLLILRQRDAQRRLKEQQALLELGARLKIVLEQAPIILWTVDPTLHFTSSSGAALRNLGLGQGELDGRSLQDYFQTEDPEFLPIARHRQALAGEPQNYEITWRERTFLVQLVPERRGRHPVSGVLGAAVDITELKLAETALMKTHARVRHLEKMEAIGRLADLVAHDFNNFLTVVLGYAGSVLEELPAGAPLRFEIEEIARTAERATWLTRQLLTFSRPGKYDPEPVDLAAIVREIAPILRRQCGEGITIEIELQTKLPLILAHPAQIEQVVLNLAINARDAMAGHGKLTVTVSSEAEPEPVVVLSLCDTGVGMGAEVRARIFEPFFSTKGEGSGTGLGLAIVDAIVRERGGSITVDSAPGKGSTFHLRFPAAPGLKLLEPAPPPEPPPIGRGERLLVVEDDDSVRTFATRALESHGYTIVTARSGVEALDRLAESPTPIDLLLTDQRMPRMTGTELARRVHELHPRARVMLMSTHPTGHDAEVGGATPDFLQKPFTSAELLRRVRDALDAPLAGGA